jgi:LacI family transcriptional regulator
MAVTIKDIAEKAEVSVATVSRVINQKDIHKVGKKTQERVNQILKEMGYYPNAMARGLKTQKTQNISVVFFWYDRPLFTDYSLMRVLDGIANFLNEKKYNILMNTFDREMGTQASVYASFVNNGLSDGILAIAPPVDSQFFKDLKQGRLPYVLVNYQVNDPEVCFVDCLNTQGIFDVMEHLFQLGHHRFAFIGGDIHFSKNTLDRFNAFKYMLKKKNSALKDEYVYLGNWTEETGAHGVKKLWSLKTKPTAIVTSNDIIALGAIKQLRSMGVQIPQEVAITGFDDIPTVGFSDPALTTVHHPLYDIGYEAARMLWNKIGKTPLDYSHRFFPTRLIIRESCGYYLKTKN